MISARAQPREPTQSAPGLVGDNLGAALDTARQDALYAQILFLFLGVPGAILAGLVTALDRLRRRRATAPRRGAAAHPRGLDADARTRSPSARRCSPASVGVLVGLGAALADRQQQLRHGLVRRRNGVGAVLWSVGAALVGLAIAGDRDRAARPCATRGR